MVKKKEDKIIRLIKQALKTDKKIDRLTAMTQEELHALYERQTSVETRVTMIEGRLTDFEERLGRKIDEGFARVERRLDTTIQPQLDAHAKRIKVLEDKVLPR